MLHVIILVVLLMLFTLFAQQMLKWKKARACKCALWIIVGFYFLGNLYFSLLSRMPQSTSQIDLVPFHIYVYLLSSHTAVQKYFTVFKAIGLEATSPWVGITLNILLYYPLGYLLPILFPKIKPKHVILIGCLYSIATEATQYLLKMGWCETDDVIHNTLGTAIGVWVWMWQSKRLKTVADQKSGQD